MSSSAAKTLVLDGMLNSMWKSYLSRVSHAAKYAELMEQKGGRAMNDHIAFRSVNTFTGSQPAGGQALIRLFEPLGYTVKGEYVFPDKHLTAKHLQHATNPNAPKIFVSQLEVEKLPKRYASMVKETVMDAVDPLSNDAKSLLKLLEQKENVSLNVIERTYLINQLLKCFVRPWSAPLRDTVVQLDTVSQYASWLMLHGNSVNHFTAYINQQNVPDLPTIEATIEYCKQNGIPMKDGDIVGPSFLRQTASRAVMEDCVVRENDGGFGTLNWSYAYYEFAQRGELNGELYEGFLEDNTPDLFNVTKVKKAQL